MSVKKTVSDMNHNVFRRGGFDPPHRVPVGGGGRSGTGWRTGDGPDAPVLVSCVGCRNVSSYTGRDRSEDVLCPRVPPSPGRSTPGPTQRPRRRSLGPPVTRPTPRPRRWPQSGPSQKGVFSHPTEAHTGSVHGVRCVEYKLYVLRM